MELIDDIELKTDETLSPSPLMLSAYEGDEKQCDLLLKKGAEIDAVWSNHTALSIAVCKGHLNIVKIFIKNGLGEKSLHLAAMNGHSVVIRQLIAKGVNVETLYKSECGVSATPLTLAIEFKQPEAAIELIEAGADIEVKNPGGYTPLLASLALGLTDVAKQLIKSGCNVNAQTNDHEDALQLALKAGNSEIANIIKEIKGP